MKIAVIAPSQVPSNTANSIQVMKVCQAFTQLNHQVCLWLPGDYASQWDALAELYGLSTPFKIRWLPSPIIWKRYDLAWKALRQASVWQADIVYTWMLQTTTLALHFNKPVILEIHMLPSGRLGPLLFKYIVKSRARKRLLFITDALRRRLEEFCSLKLMGKDIRIAPMGSEPDRFVDVPSSPQAARRELGLPEGFTAAYSGHFYAGRGIEILYDLAKSLPHIHFLWIGGRQNDIDYWKRRLDEDAVSNVAITGFIPNQHLPLYLAAADVLLMPYATKVSVSSLGNTADVCSPMKMFDYLSSGRAIITSDLPVLHEVLNDSNAVFCPPDDYHAWHKALIDLSLDEARCHKLAAQAKVDAKKYTWLARARQSIQDFP